MCCIYRCRRLEKLVAILAILSIYILIISQLHLSDDSMKKVKKYLDTNDVFERNSVKEITEEIVKIGYIANAEKESRKEVLAELSRGDLADAENEALKGIRKQKYDELKNLEKESRKERLKELKRRELSNLENESRKMMVKELAHYEKKSREERHKELINHGKLLDFKIDLIKKKITTTPQNHKTFLSKNQLITKSFINEDNTNMTRKHGRNKSVNNAKQKNKIKQITPSVDSLNTNLRNDSKRFIKPMQNLSLKGTFHPTMPKQTRRTSFSDHMVPPTSFGDKSNYQTWNMSDDNEKGKKNITVSSFSLNKYISKGRTEPIQNISLGSTFHPTIPKQTRRKSVSEHITTPVGDRNNYQTLNVSGDNEKEKKNITSSAFSLNNNVSKGLTEAILNVSLRSTFQPTKPLEIHTTIFSQQNITVKSSIGGDNDKKNRSYRIRNTIEDKGRIKNQTRNTTPSAFSLDNKISNKFTEPISNVFLRNISYPTNKTYKKVVKDTHYTKHVFKRAKLLLLYTPMFGRIPWRSTPYDYTFTELDYKTPCPINNCRVTYNKTRINESDAVYFHGRDLPSSKELRELRRKVDKRQIWIWFMHESPEFTFYNSKDEYDGIFNWTSTYSPKSEIFIPYFGIRNLKDNERQTKTENFTHGKDKMVLFINSHCDALRMNFIRRLKKYVQVDVYGRCKNMINPELPECPRNSDKCRKIQSRYKFYLAIENSFCEDYVTEKYYKNAMQRGIVPLIMGGADYNDSRIVLPHSFINIRDYKNLKELGDYLNYLNSNDTAYNEYFKWTKSYKVELQHGMCKVCNALWEHNDSESKVVKLSEFWNSSSKCIDKTKIIKGYV